MTILWHMDDLKVSHASSKIVDDFIEWVKTTKYAMTGEEDHLWKSPHLSGDEA